MKNIRLKIIGIIVGESLIFTTLMWLYHGFYMMRDTSYFSNKPYIFWSVVPLILFISSVVILLQLRSMPGLIRRLETGGDTAPDDIQLGIKLLRKLPRTVITVNIVGFFFGPVINNVVNVIVSGEELVLYQLILTVLYCVSIGAVGAILEISSIDTVLLDFRRALRIHEIADQKRDLGYRIQNIGFVLILAFFFGMILFCAGFGFLREAAIDNSIVADRSLKEVLMPMIGQMTILLIILMAIISSAAYVFINEQHLKLKNVQKTMNKLSEGDLDLGSRLTILGFDEIGRLTQSINRFISRQQNLLDKVLSVSHMVNANVSNLENSVTEVSDAMTETGASITTVKESVSTQGAKLTNTVGALKILSTSIDEVAGHINRQAEVVDESSSAITEMTANIASVNESVTKADERVSRMKTVADGGRTVINDTLTAMKEIQEASSSVLKAIDVISKISAQTNLLAMNAAIEAAHAGDSGRGFAVVATEVRNLAEISTKSTKEISQSLKNVAQKIEIGSDLANRAGAAFQEVSTDIDTSADLISSISLAMREQKAGTEDIVKSFNVVVELTREIKRISGDQDEKQKGMAEAMDSLSQAARRIDESVEIQVGDGEKIGSAVDKLREVARNTVTVLDELNQIVQNLSSSTEKV